MTICSGAATMKGTYLFFARLSRTGDIRINRKGQTHHFHKGWYAYVGSALGPGGFKSRLNRHFHGSGNPHWNIDYFRLSVVPFQKAWVSCEDQRLESRWSAVFQFMPGVHVPIVNFGNADLRGRTVLDGTAPTHLFHSSKKPVLAEFQKLLDHYFPGGQPVREVLLPL